MKEKHHTCLSLDWAFLSTNTSLLPVDSMGNTRQWLFSSSDARPSREINGLFIFRHKCARKKTTPILENTMMQEMRPTCQPHRSPGRLVLFYLCSTLLPFHTLRYFTNCSALAPRGKRAENRMWIHPRLTNTLGETHAAVLAAQTCLFDLLPVCLKQNALKQEGFVVMPSKQCFNLISIT